MSGPTSITVRLNDPELAGLQTLAARWGVNNSDALRGLIRLASAAEADPRLVAYQQGLLAGVTDGHRAIQSVLDEAAKLQNLIQAQVAAMDAPLFGQAA